MKKIIIAVALLGMGITGTAIAAVPQQTFTQVGTAVTPQTFHSEPWKVFKIVGFGPHHKVVLASKQGEVLALDAPKIKQQIGKLIPGETLLVQKAGGTGGVIAVSRVPGIGKALSKDF